MIVRSQVNVGDLVIHVEVVKLPDVSAVRFEPPDSINPGADTRHMLRVGAWIVRIEWWGGEKPSVYIEPFEAGKDEGGSLKP